MTVSAVRVIEAQWPAPRRVRALTTTRSGGVSAPPYDALNLACHVGDAAEAVGENRRRLGVHLGLPAEPLWLRQVHGTRIVEVDHPPPAVLEADGTVTVRPNIVCAVLTADCLPLFLTDRAGARVGCVHVGWRGLAAGIVERGVAALGADPAEVLAWLGPAIGREHFEVGSEVRVALAVDAPSAACIVPAPCPGKWLADLYGLVSQRLRASGVSAVYTDTTLCTYRDGRRFYSYRRDRDCGRMASLIWLMD